MLESRMHHHHNSQVDNPNVSDEEYDSDCDMESDVSFRPFNNAPSVAYSMYSATSYDVSMRSGSPTPSVMSATDSLLERTIVEEYGRGINASSDVYKLPGDEEEIERLNRQEILITAAGIGKYPPPMDEVMEDNVPGEPKCILDLGCGSGSWLIQAALDYPECQAVGVDLIPLQAHDLPPNCRSEVDDINLGIEHFFGDFDVVHTRILSGGIADYRHLVDQISRVLRPGGLIDLNEFDYHICDGNKRRIQLLTDDFTGPWWPRWLYYGERAMRRRGASPDAANYMYHWVKEHPAFENVVYRNYFMPVNAAKANEELGPERARITKDLMHEGIAAFMRAGRPLLLSEGMSEDLLDQLERNVIEEVSRPGVAYYACFQSVYARKKLNPPDY